MILLTVFDVGRLKPGIRAGPSVEDAAVRETVSSVGISIASNTVLFTGLDLGQWLADKLSLSTLLTNLVAAVIATAFGLLLTEAARMLRLRSLD